MKILRLAAAITVVVCLILAASVPALALKDKPPNVKEKPTKVVPQVPPGQAKKTPKPEHIPKPKKTPKPESIPQPGEDPVAKVEICHKPGTPAQKTLWLPEPAVPGHLGHGDVLGACEDLTPTPTVTPTVTLTPTLVTICHKPGTPAEQTLELPEAAVSGHLGHGDVLGACGEEVPPEGALQEAGPVPWTTRLVTAGLSLFLILRGFVASLPL